MDTKGLHVISDIWFSEMPSKKLLDGLIKKAIKGSKMNLVNEAEYVFGDNAFTYAGLLSESHLCIHTYPERLYAALDIYACGAEGDAVLANQIIISGCQVWRCQTQILTRGT